MLRVKNEVKSRPRIIAYVVTVICVLIVCLSVDWFSRGGPSEENTTWMIIQTASSCLLVAGTGLLAGRYCVLFHGAFISMLAVVVCFSAFVTSHYGYAAVLIGREWPLIILCSSWSEACEFFRYSLTIVDWICIAVIPVALVAVIAALFRLRPCKHSFGIALSGVLMCVPYVLSNRPPHPCSDRMFATLFDNPFCFDGESLRCWRDISRAGKITDRSFACGCDSLVGVFVIGESSTRSHWSLYGYDRDTTRRLDSIRDELIVFTNVTTDCWMTTPSLRSHLTDYVADSHPATISLPSSLRAAGFRSVLLSGQDHWGHIDGVVSMMFRSCSEIKCLLDICKGREYYDDSLVPLLGEELSMTNALKAVFVHLAGSHREFVKRCPRERIRFGSADDVNAIDAYDNSIAFTDEILFAMIEQLRGLDVPSFLVYVSDHGEDPYSQWRSQSNLMKEIPLVVWMSSEYRGRFPKMMREMQRVAGERLNSDSLFKIYSDMFMLHEKEGT